MRDVVVKDSMMGTTLRGLVSVLYWELVRQ